MGSPKFFDASLHACHALMTPAGLRNLTLAIPLRGLLGYVPDGHLHLHLPFGAVPDLREVRSPLRPTWFPVYASNLSFGSSFDSPPTGLQHSVRVAGYALPGRDSHPARSAKLVLAHTLMAVSVREPRCLRFPSARPPVLGEFVSTRSIKPLSIQE